ncbi:MAG: DUF488 domain-containing protein [Nitrospirota bacterium]|nr:DUF488 domain-containing protein [Nitrospirota bacterium]
MTTSRGIRNQQAILTVGHSTRPIEAFLDLLRAQGVKRVIDVRTIPRSRHNPQFNRETLPQTLRQAGIGYTHLPELGGLRHAQRDSPNMGWRNTSFRGYADYMQTPAFEAGLDTLMTAGEREPIVVMCAEAVPWRCHRSLIADALSIRGISVEHILSATRTQPHALTPFAQVHGARITYPADQLSLDQLSLDASSPGVPAVSVASSQRRTLAGKGTRTRKGGPKPARP